MKRSQLTMHSVSAKHSNLEEAFAAYSAAGFINVEFVMSHLKEYLDDGHTTEDIKSLLDSHGLNATGGFELELSAFADAEATKANRAGLRANAEILSEIGADMMVVGTDGPGSGSDLNESLDVLARAFAEVAEEIRDTGVSIAAEFNWSPFIKSVRTAAELARRADHENVGVLFDTAHYHCTPSKLEQLTAENVATIFHFHINDMRDQPGEFLNCNSDRVLPGQGCLDLKEICSRIEGHGYTGFVSIEMFTQSLYDLPVETAAQQMYDSLLHLCEDG